MPIIQEAVVDYASSYLSEKMKTEVSVEEVNIRFFLDVELKGVVIKDRHDIDFINVEKLVLNVKLLELMTSSISFDKIEIYNPIINMIWYEGEDYFNFQILFNEFNSDKEKKEKNTNFILKCDELSLYNASYHLQNQNKDTTFSSAINFNNIYADNIQLQFQNIVFSQSTLYAQINYISARERSGFVLDTLRSQHLIISPAYVIANKLQILTANSDINCDFGFEYSSIDDFQDFVNTVFLRANFENTQFSMLDMAYFSKDLKGMDSEFLLQGNLYGTVNDLRTSDFNLAFGESSHLTGKFHLKNLAFFEDFSTYSKIEDLTIDIQDLKDFNLPRGQKIILDERLGLLGVLKGKGRVDGSLEDMNCELSLNSMIGSTDINLHLNKDSELDILNYNGSITANNLQLGKIFMQDDLGSASLDVVVNGSGIDANASLNIEGNISDITYNNYRYSDIDVDVSVKNKLIKGEMLIDDKYLKMHLIGEVIRGDTNEFDLNASINEAHLRKLNFIERDSSAVLSALLNCKFKGDNIDNIIGNISAENINYFEKNKYHKIENLVFIVEQIDSLNKKLSLRSDVVDADVNGKINFSKLDKSLELFIKDYLPSYSTNNDIFFDSENIQEFDYNVFFKQPQILFDLFAPSLEMSNNAVFEGKYNSLFNTLSIEGGAEFLKYNGISIKNWFVKGETFNSNIYLNFGSDFVGTNDSVGINNVYLNTIAFDDSINYSLFWDNYKDMHQNSGDLRGYFSFANKQMIRSKIVYGLIEVDDLEWVFSQENNIRILGDSVILDNIALSHKEQLITLKGLVSPNPKDNITLSFSNFDVSNLDSLLISYQLSLDGFLSGDIVVSEIYKNPRFLANFQLKSLVMNDVKMGDLNVRSNWDGIKKAIYNDIDLVYKGSVGQIIPIKMDGYFYPDKKDSYLDLQAHFENFKIDFLNPYLSSFASNLQGKAIGDIDITGRFDSLNLEGALKIIRGGIKIDYLNTFYTFTDFIYFKGNKISFESLTMYDMYGNNAVCDGDITHNTFKDFQFDLSIKPKKLMFLNTGSNTDEMFYGKAFASGLARIYGDEELITIAVDVKTEKGTVLYIPIDYSGEVYENDFIHFVSIDTTKTIMQTEEKTDLSGVVMDMIIDVTPDAEVQIIFDSKVGDIIRGRGNGDLSIEVNKEGDYSMIGNYTITSGDYLFTLEGIINKKFEIVPGGTIMWTGDIYEANIDIKAKYPIKAPLYDLVMHIDSSDVYKKAIPVDVILGMKNNLFNPDISFDIELPASDENAKAMLKSMISTEQEMNRQVFSLMVLNSFMPTEQNTYANPISVSTTEMFSNQLSNWLSQISNDFDIGVNYRPGDQITNDQVEVALSTQLFNDRITIDGDVGVGGNDISQQNEQNSNNVVGDVVVEYKISNKLRIKVYNRSNAIDPLTDRAPYSQGVAIFYRKEFDRFGDLFIRKQKKKAID